MREVLIQTAETVSTREVTYIMVKIIYSTYEKTCLKYVATNIAHLNDGERNQLVYLLK